MRISDWISDVCSSDLKSRAKLHQFAEAAGREVSHFEISAILTPESEVESVKIYEDAGVDRVALTLPDIESIDDARRALETFSNKMRLRSDEHTSELQSLMRLSYAVFCLKKKN